jgi:hypothetical protein
MNERTAVASMCCACGKIISKETMLSGILDFVAGAEASGWGFDERGFVRCPECSSVKKDQRGRE